MEYNHVVWVTIIPALLFVVYIYFRDKYRREPISVVLATYVWGICGGGVLLLLHHWLNIPSICAFPQTIGWEQVWQIIAGACIDQIMILILLYLLLRNNKFADEHTDRIVYAASIAMGVITTYGVAYCLMNSPSSILSSGVLRALTLIPIFFACGILLGYYCSSLKIRKLPIFSIKLPILIIVPVFFQCILSYLFLFLNIEFGLTGSFIMLFVLTAIGLFTYKLCADSIENSQIRDVDEKRVKSMYDTSRYIKNE